MCMEIGLEAGISQCSYEFVPQAVCMEFVMTKYKSEFHKCTYFYSDHHSFYKNFIVILCV
jgi:hypothetical protein